MMPNEADAEFHLGIDEWILDYLIYTAIRDVLDDYKTLRIDVDHGYEQEKGALSLQLVNSFLIMFRSMHPSYSGSQDLQFRLRLLSFTVMFTKRATPAETTPSALELQKLQDRRREHARSFRSKDEVSLKPDLTTLIEHFASPDNLQIKQERFTQDANIFAPSSSAQRSPLPAVSLLDTLPFFMALSAAHNDMMDEARITRVWMLLAAGYMAQAAMEQYLLHGYPGKHQEQVLREAFAWGFDAECGADPGSDQWRINAMFWGDDEVVPGWDAIRDDHWHALIPPEGTDLQEHFRNLMANNFPVAKFEDNVIDFLWGLLDGQPRPLLAQLESGKVEGLSRKETRALQKRIGIT